MENRDGGKTVAQAIVANQNIDTVFKILDRYIIRKFLGTYIFAIILLLAIVVMFDINEKFDSFVKAPLKATIFDYFLNFLPYFANQFSPLFYF